ncbi:hypothetical protein N482_00255 [Pseudoalteromonas luteoviolacea NCIMB 1942]|uniref:Uncharacterized protein n=1 Tax=Pseudoalteromonas luteoviolacea NCIMB 1942 TaxID=1365253 RepID=A0A161YF40_9GAMM|nr:hypothetical protein N482_00255 [Pseudoalteromonas luteoviolacea NCIMB 1942]
MLLQSVIKVYVKACHKRKSIIELFVKILAVTQLYFVILFFHGFKYY